MKVQGKRSQENGPKAEKDQTERPTELGRGDIRNPRPPFGEGLTK